MQKRLLFSIALLCLILPSVRCQNVTNATACQEGQNIAVYYDLDGNANICLEMTIQGTKHPMYSLSGDIGKYVEKGKKKKIVWHVLDDSGTSFDAKDVVFTVKAFPTWRTFVVAEGAMSFAPLQGSGGVMVGRVARWGYYAKIRSSFMFAPMNGSFDVSTGYLNGYGTININALESRFTGKKRNTELVADIGAMYNMSRSAKYPVCLYFGGGFGMRQQMWEIDHGNWVKYSPSSYIGFSGDLGILASIKGFVVEVGVNTINFQYMEIQLGLGYMFNR